MLVISCEYLAGTVVATDVADRDRAEWPPHPGRLFSALVSAYGEGGAPPEERKALEWLETLGPPDVHAPEASVRTAGEHYVPVNDTSLGTRKDAGGGAIGLLPPYRTRQARTFPTVVLPDAHRAVHFVWPEVTVSDAHLTALQAMAIRVGYVGHSRSLVRLCVGCTLADEQSAATRVWRAASRGSSVLRIPAPGRLRELETLHAAGQRPTIGAVTRYAVYERHPVPVQGTLRGEWIPLRFAGHVVPAMEAWPHVAWMLRRALIRCVDNSLADELSEEERRSLLAAISGHAADGAPLQGAHVAYVPLANVGFGRYSSGLLLGAAIVLPHDDDPLIADALQAAISRSMVATPEADTHDGQAFALHLGETGVAYLAFAAADLRRSLAPERYLATSLRWTTVTPVVLDRFPRGSDDVPGIIAEACRHAGLPRPIRVEAHKHAACAGVAPARPRTRRPGMPGAWRTAWRDESGAVVDRFGNRPLTHVTLTFDVPVCGPVILGAGRYSGLGLCLPISEVVP